MIVNANNDFLHQEQKIMAILLQPAISQCISVILKKHKSAGFSKRSGLLTLVPSIFE